MLHFVQHDSKRIQHTTNPLCITANQFYTTKNPLNTAANQFKTTKNPFNTSENQFKTKANPFCPKVRSNWQRRWIAVVRTGGEPSVEPPPGGL